MANRIHVLKDKDLLVLAQYEYGKENVESVIKTGKSYKTKDFYQITLKTGEHIYMSRSEMKLLAEKYVNYMNALSEIFGIIR